MKKTSLFIFLFSAFWGMAGCNDSTAQIPPAHSAKNMFYEQNNSNNQHASARHIPNRAQFNIANGTAGEIEVLKEVESAIVIFQNRNAYAAIALKNSSSKNVSDDLKRKITNQIKASYSEIDHVFISSNPYFLERMTEYREQIETGRPAKGLTEEFNKTIQRIFPE